MNQKLLPLCLILFLLMSFAARAEWPVDNTDKTKAIELFKHRHEKPKLEESIKLMETYLTKEKDYEVAVLLSRAWYLLAEHTDDNSQKLDLHDKGLKAGEMAMEMTAEFANAMKTTKEEEAIKSITKEKIDGLYWTAANLARWAKFASFTKKVASKSRVRYLWDRIYELDPNYFYGGAYRFFGSYYALVPAITGDQDPVKSKEMFEKAVTASPGYLETKILYAEAYCTHAKIKDRELFKKLLKDVISTDLNSQPEIYAENLIAKGKAEKLLSDEQNLFE